MQLNTDFNDPFLGCIDTHIWCHSARIINALQHLLLERAGRYFIPVMIVSMAEATDPHKW